MTGRGSSSGLSGRRDLLGLSVGEAAGAHAAQSHVSRPSWNPSLCSSGAEPASLRTPRSAGAVDPHRPHPGGSSSSKGRGLASAAPQSHLTAAGLGSSACLWEEPLLRPLTPHLPSRCHERPSKLSPQPRAVTRGLVETEQENNPPPMDHIRDRTLPTLESS